jgi:hypothetical protein
MIHKYWLSIARHDSKPLAEYNIPWFTTTGSAEHTMIHNHCLRITHHDAQIMAHYNST